MTVPSRALKLFRIGQAHLAENMDLSKWTEIMQRHDCYDLDDWSDVDDATVDALIADIAAVVRGAARKEKDATHSQ